MERTPEYIIIPKLQLVAKSVATPLDKKGHIVQTLTTWKRNLSLMKPGLLGYSTFAGFMFTGHNLYTLVTAIRENFLSVFLRVSGMHKYPS
jgi:hypothetical protein